MTLPTGTRVHLYEAANLPLGPVGSATVISHHPYAGACPGCDGWHHSGQYLVQRTGESVPVLWPVEQVREPESARRSA